MIVLILLLGKVLAKKMHKSEWFKKHLADAIVLLFGISEGYLFIFTWSTEKQRKLPSQKRVERTVRGTFGRIPLNQKLGGFKLCLF